MEPSAAPGLDGGSAAATAPVRTQALIKVGAASEPAKIASVIANAAYRGQEVKIRAIGASAVNQANKACAIARGFVAERGMNMYFIIGFENLQDRDDDRPISAIGITVVLQ